MQNFAEILAKKGLKKEEKHAKFEWQEKALEIIEYLQTPQKNKSMIFKICKEDPNTALRAYTNCQELNKPFTQYFFKLYSEFRKQYEAK